MAGSDSGFGRRAQSRYRGRRDTGDGQPPRLWTTRSSLGVRPLLWVAYGRQTPNSFARTSPKRLVKTDLQAKTHNRLVVVKSVTVRYVRRKSVSVYTTVNPSIHFYLCNPGGSYSCPHKCPSRGPCARRRYSETSFYRRGYKDEDLKVSSSRGPESRDRRTTPCLRWVPDSTTGP